MKVFSLFAGIGAPEKALSNLGIDYNLVGFSEIDKYAVKSYCAVHGVDEALNYGDITKIDETELPNDIDLITYGFPCQDISLAGKQKGLFNADGTQTRSGLFFEALRIIEATQPRVAIAENVKNLTGKKFKLQFEIVLKCLENAGYNNYWKVLNAKDFGIPQNRERVFIVSIRKDIDTGEYEFPEGFPLELKLKDMLEDEVDEKFYISDATVAKIQNSTFGQEKSIIQHGDVRGTLLARDYKDPKCVSVEPGFVNGDICKTVRASGHGSLDRHSWDIVADPKCVADGISPTMDSCSGGNRMPKVMVREATKKGYADPQQAVVIDEVKRIVSATRKCDVGVTVQDNGDIRPHRLDKKKSGVSEMQINKDTNLSNTITAGHMPKVYGDSTNLRIRKLTPKECWRLMGFEDEDFEKAEAVNSNTQLYKQAGNSIVVPVLENLYIQLFKCGALR